MRPTVPEILEELRLNRGYFPREAVEAAMERREEMVPELLRILDEAAERPEELLEEPAAIGHLYAPDSPARGAVDTLLDAVCPRGAEGGA